MGIVCDVLGPKLVAFMWDEASADEIGGYLVVDNLAMGALLAGVTGVFAAETGRPVQWFTNYATNTYPANTRWFRKATNSGPFFGGSGDTA